MTLPKGTEVNLHKRIKALLSSLNFELISLSVMMNMLHEIQEVHNSHVGMLIGIFYSSMVVISHHTTEVQDYDVHRWEFDMGQED